MFAYAMLGTNDVERAIGFYEPLMAILGQPRCWTGKTGVSWGSLDDYSRPGFCIGKPFDGDAASAGNGVMLALRAPSEELVDQLYVTAIKGGARCEGKPGLRPQYGPGFYYAYVRDPDGNKLAFACYGKQNGS